VSAPSSSGARNRGVQALRRMSRGQIQPQARRRGGTLAARAAPGRRDGQSVTGCWRCTHRRTGRSTYLGPSGAPGRPLSCRGRATAAKRLVRGRRCGRDVSAPLLARSRAPGMLVRPRELPPAAWPAAASCRHLPESTSGQAAGQAAPATTHLAMAMPQRLSAACTAIRWAPPANDCSTLGALGVRWASVFGVARPSALVREPSAAPLRFEADWRRRSGAGAGTGRQAGAPRRR
jgi:hypothetical protein